MHCELERRQRRLVKESSSCKSQWLLCSRTPQGWPIAGYRAVATPSVVWMYVRSHASAVPMIYGEGTVRRLAGDGWTVERTRCQIITT